MRYDFSYLGVLELLLNISDFSLAVEAREAAGDQFRVDGRGVVGSVCCHYLLLSGVAIELTSLKKKVPNFLSLCCLMTSS